MPLITSEFTSDFFVSPKFFIFYLICLSLLLFGSFLKGNSLIKIPKSIIGPLAICGCFYFTFQAFFWTGSYGVVTYELLCFLVIVFFSHFSSDEHFLKKIVLFNLAVLLCVVSTILISIIGKNPSSLDLFFGNRNHLAEFLGASVIIQIICYKVSLAGSKVLKVLSAYSIVGALYICVITLCRSVLLSLIVCVLVYLLMQIFNSVRNKKFTTSPVTVFVLLSILLASSFFGYKTFFSGSSETAYIKSATTNLRLIRWKNTLEMIKDRPLGFGPSSYEFAYLEYKDKKENDFEATETVLIKSPHNGYLELFSEYSFAVGFTFLFVLFIVIYKFALLPIPIYFYIVLFFSINAFFSFPMELPFSSYLIAIFVGSGLREISGEDGFKIDLKFLSRILLVPFGIYTAIVILSTVSSNLAEDKFNSKEFCSLTPSIWRNCVDAGVQAISRGDFTESSEILGKYLKLYPNNFIAQRYYAFSLAKLGKVDEACGILEKYDSLFLGKSSVHEIKMKQCHK